MGTWSNNTVTDRFDRVAIDELLPDIIYLAGYNSLEDVKQTLLNLLFVPGDMQLGERSKFEEFMNNKLNNEDERMKFLQISNKLIRDKKITIRDIIHTIEQIDQHWYNYNVNVFFYCFFIEKILEEKKMDLKSLESSLNNPEFSIKLVPVNSANVSKDIRSAISLLWRRSVFNYEKQPENKNNLYY